MIIMGKSICYNGFYKALPVYVCRAAVFIVSLVTRGRIFAYAKTKAQISCAVTAQMISAFVFATRIDHSSSYIRNFKLLTFFCDNAGRFVSGLVGNSEDRFSRVAAHSGNIIFCKTMKQFRNNA